MAVRITRNGIEGVDTNTSWTGTTIPSGYTKNIYRWGSGGVDRGNDTVGLTPFAYCHWGQGGTASQTNMNRRWNVSSVSRTGTGAYRVNFSDAINQSYAVYEFQGIGVFVGARRHTGSNNMVYGNYYDVTTSKVDIQFRTHSGSAVDPGYMWVMVLGGGKGDLTDSGTFRIEADRMYKYDPDGTTARTMHKAMNVRFAGDGITTGSTATVYSGGSSFYTSILKHAVGEYTTTFNYRATSPIDSTGYPIAFCTTHRPSGTGTGIACPESSETYIGNQIRWRSTNLSNGALDQYLNIVVF